MFDIGWSEMALVAVLALVVIGPKELPKVLRQLGMWVKKARSLAADFRRGMDDMVRESEMAELRAEVERLKRPYDLQREMGKALDPDGQIAQSLENKILKDDLPSNQSNESVVSADSEAKTTPDMQRPPQP